MDTPLGRCPIPQKLTHCTVTWMTHLTVRRSPPLVHLVTVCVKVYPKSVDLVILGCALGIELGQKHLHRYHRRSSALQLPLLILNQLRQLVVKAAWSVRCLHTNIKLLIHTQTCCT